MWTKGGRGKKKQRHLKCHVPSEGLSTLKCKGNALPEASVSLFSKGSTYDEKFEPTSNLKKLKIRFELSALDINPTASTENVQPETGSANSGVKPSGVQVAILSIAACASA